MVALAFGWRHVLFANWPIAPERIEPHLPAGLSVDTIDGDGWLSVVAFVNVDTRPRKLPAAVGVDVPELNLRTYVLADGEPGVYFFNLDVPSVAVVLGARLTHHLPYFHADVDVETSPGRLNVRSERRHPGAPPARFDATCEPDDDPFTPTPESLAAFLTERRRLYTAAQDETIRYTDVSHPAWTLYPADVAVLANTVFRAEGFPTPETAPRCYYSPGVDVVTTKSKRWQGARRPRDVQGDRRSVGAVSRRQSAE